MRHKCPQIQLAILKRHAVPKIFTQLSTSTVARKAEGDRLPQTVRDDEWPTVDVFVTYCGESIQTIVNTVKAACVLNYPQELVRVVVLDDSDSSKLVEMVDQLGKEYPNLSYASRKVQVTTHSKAANLNFGLHFVDTLKAGGSDYVAVLDVDMIPEPDWLQQVLPHVLNNPRAALACPPQRFYNLPDGDPLGIKLDFLPIECIMHLQDFSNNSRCSGSGFVARRIALDDIGGFPESLLQEDVLTSYYLSTAGWQSIYVPNTVQWGLGPDTVSAFLKQCQRWMVGLLSISHFAWTEGASKLSPEARLNGVLWGIVFGSASFIWTFALVALPLLVATGRILIATGTPGQLRLLSRLATLDFAAQSLYHILMSSILDHRMSFDGHFTAIWNQPWRAWITLRYFVIPKLFGRPIPNFTPTGIKMDGEAERAARSNGSWIACSKTVFWDCGAGSHLLMCMFCVAGAGTWARRALDTLSGEGARNAAELLMVGIAWPHVLCLWVTLARSAWVPFAYAWRPIPAPNGYEMLARNATHGVEYASAKVKEDYMRKPSQWSFVLKCCFYVAGTLIVESS